MELCFVFSAVDQVLDFLNQQQGNLLVPSKLYSARRAE